MDEFALNIETPTPIDSSVYQATPKQKKEDSKLKKVSNWVLKTIPFARTIKESYTGITVYDDKRMNKAIQNHHKRKTIKIGGWLTRALT